MSTDDDLTKQIYAAASAGAVDTILLCASRPTFTVAMLDRPNHIGRTPMHAAAAKGSVPAVATLHRLGAASIDRPDHYGRTPTYLAAQRGHVAVVEALHRLGSRAISRPRTSGWTPIQVAIVNGHTATVEACLRLGCAGVDSDTAHLVSFAVQHNRTPECELLFAAGAKVDLLADRYPAQVRALHDMPVERLLAMRQRLFFAGTLLQALLAALDQPSDSAAEQPTQCNAL